MRALLVLLLASPVWAASEMPLEFDEAGVWEPKPTYQANPADAPEIVHADGTVTLGVSESGRGMKFEAELRPFDSASAAYLVMRYKARNLAGGYALWAYDGSRGGKEILNTSKLVADGEWHLVAVDLWAAGAVGPVRALVTEVRCGGAPASVTFDYLRLEDELPAGTAVFPAEGPEAKELVFRPGEEGPYTPEPDWLANGGEDFGAEAVDGALYLHADEAGKGMKWSLNLAEPIDLSLYRFAAVRYRARNVGPSGDYFIWLGSESGGQPQESRSVVRLPELRDDGEWHVAVRQLPEDFTAVEMALQAQAGPEGAGEVWLESIRFSTHRPLVGISDLVPVERGWGGSRLPAGSFAAVDLSAQATPEIGRRLRTFGLREWLPEGKITVRGIPFEIPQGDARAAASARDALEPVSLPVSGRGSEAYVLMTTGLPMIRARRAEYDTQMASLAEVERLVFEVEYADGLVDEVFPVCVSSGEHEVLHGIEVYCLTGLRDARLAGVRLRNFISGASYLIGAVTLNQGARATSAPEVLGLPGASPVTREGAGRGRITQTADGFAIENDLLRMDLRTEGGVWLRSVRSKLGSGADLTVEAGPLFEFGAGETLLTSEDVTVGEARVERDGGVARLVIEVDGTPGGVPIAGELTITVGDGADIRMELDVRNVGDAAISPVVNFPTISGARMGSAEDTWYLYGRKGGIISNQPIARRSAYGGEHPLQVSDVFSPEAGHGLALLTYDLADILRYWGLQRDATGVSWRMEYFVREHQPGERIEIAPTALRAHSGDWRRALGIYSDWVRTWYAPQVARKEWFQRAFYYQQVTAWSTLRDRQTGQWRTEEVVREFKDYFGRLDYLHIFDFGQSMKYGRVGDYSHYEELGGLEKMRGEIKKVQDMGIPVGLYIEGYLCDERGVWGSENCTKYDIRKRDGEPLLWPGAPTEHMMCAAAEGWRDHLAATYKRVAGELKPDGMYIDQYGFINDWKICHSREHGHPSPWGPMRGERDTTKAIRAGIPVGVANLTEETPNDVNCQYQDGALGYSVWQSDPRLMPHRVDLLRFVLPDFKVFQLTQYEPFTEGHWTKLKFPFFNGEGYWLGGGVSAYSEPAHGFLKKALEILNEYEDAFCSADVTPLIPTLRGTIFANEFRAPGMTVWTVFNAEYRTFRGEALRVPHVAGAKYTDAFTGEEVAVKVRGGEAVLPVEIGPRGVGCIVQSSGK